MCEIELTPTGALIVSAVGCWSVGFCSALSSCLAGRVCAKHRKCRRCFAAAASAAMLHGVAGPAVASIALWKFPDSPLLVSGIALIVGGLAGMKQADWHALTAEMLRGAICGAQRFFGRRDADEQSHEEPPTDQPN